METLILRLHIERKSFLTPTGESRQILGSIQVSLGQREILAIAGPSGCGKTTLLRVAGGLDTSFRGTLTWRDGKPPRIGTVFQEPRLLAWRTVRQNVLLAQPTPNPVLADRLLDTLDLTSARDAWPTTLSLGMARRAAIARAFAVEPELILLDEPFVSLDPAMAARGRELLLAAWRASPVAVILVTHDHAEAAALADRILVLGGDPTTVVEEIIIPEAARRRVDSPVPRGHAS